MSHDERVSIYKEKKHRELDAPFARLDAIYWISAIYSREAMTVNHLSAHRYGDRKALGHYRITASILSIITFTFLTIYEIFFTTNRFYLTLSWWVSLDTVIFFCIT